MRVMQCHDDFRSNWETIWYALEHVDFDETRLPLKLMLEMFFVEMSEPFEMKEAGNAINKLEEDRCLEGSPEIDAIFDGRK